jgi:hypothetical protein
LFYIILNLGHPLDFQFSHFFVVFFLKGKKKKEFFIFQKKKIVSKFIRIYLSY